MGRMGLRKKVGSLLKFGGFNTSELKTILNLAVSRLAMLKRHRQSRCSIARSDLLQILHLGNHDAALLRAEQVIREQNMLDVYDLLEHYCDLMLERIHLFQTDKECPEELVEAVSSLIHASTRFGDFPELKEIRSIFASRYGNEFVASAVELRNNCGVNPKIVQKSSTRKPNLEDRMKLLKKMASDNNIVLHLETVISPVHAQAECISSGESVTDSKYKNVAHAAQVAFESAAYAATAAGAAVELARSESIDPDDSSSKPPERHYSDKIKKTEEWTQQVDGSSSDSMKERKVESELEAMEKLEENEKKDPNSSSALSDEEGQIKVETPRRQAVFDNLNDENEYTKAKHWSEADEWSTEEKDVEDIMSTSSHDSSVKHVVLRNGAEFEPQFEPRRVVEPLKMFTRPISVRTIPKQSSW